MRDWIALTKFRIQMLATSAALVCYWLAADGEWEWMAALHLVIGLTLTSSASATLNQILEIEIDKRMDRTKNRPLPTGRISQRAALVFTVVTGAVGALWLTLLLDPLTGWLSVVMLVFYCFIYTPLKQVTALNTLVGAVPGAMPLLIGYAAAGKGLDATAGVLFLILFLWQLPHFFAIAWLYRDDYARGGLRMLPGVDVHGAASGRQSVHYALALIPVSLLPTLFGIAGRIYFYGAFSLSLLFLATVIRFALRRKDRRARVVLRASIIYLPLLFLLLVLDAQLKIS